ncbi:sensor domain-containing phosphodiesterase [Roseitranquillus sediminis]|uniref:sensor domain-containing phosphodiesterase n=1 Tax=Roseitranquillus sediminis TaxID=2809051 RepID=UPI001D0C5CC1|nr:EAL domain-containing protein [Roseitranquillus sediminis]MBM9594490.1 EAL domain-containing protein [Roseitranquillus sediminis]
MQAAFLQTKLHKAMSALRENPGLLSVLQADLASEEALREIISALRIHMRMESVFLAEVGEVHRVVYLAETSAAKSLAEGRADPRERTLSHAILSGTVAEAVGDIDANPQIRGIPLCREFGVRSFVGVPVRLASGEIFGVMGCFDSRPRSDLGQSSADLIRLTADLAGRHLTRLRQGNEAASRFRQRLDQTIATGAIRFARQPVVEIATGRVAGMEYLARFSLFKGIPVNMVFEQAHLLAADRDLEGEVLRRLSKTVARQTEECKAFVNVSPEAIANGKCAEIFGALLDGMVLEVLEERLEGLEDDIRVALAASELPFSLAVDDFGVGYSNLARVVSVAPEFVKVDRSLVTSIDEDPARRALMSAVVRFARETGVQVIAEGVERSGEAAALSRAGVRLAQGYFFARPTLCDD